VNEQGQVTTYLCTDAGITDLAKDIVYNMGGRPTTVHLMIICPSIRVSARLQDILEPLLPDYGCHPVSDDGCRVTFANGSQYAVIVRKKRDKIVLFEERRERPHVRPS
jgi:hypothetical protein